MLGPPGRLVGLLALLHQTSAHLARPAHSFGFHPILLPDKQHWTQKLAFRAQRSHHDHLQMLCGSRLDDACVEIVEEVLRLGRDESARPAEQLVKKRLQAGTAGDGNVVRAKLARRCLGVTVLRGRLEYVLGQALLHRERHLPPLDTARLVLALYIREFEGTTHSRQHGEDQAASNLDDILAGRSDLQAMLSSVESSSILWPCDPVDRLAARGSLPTWLAREWLKQYGDEQAEALALEANRQGPVTLRVNLLRCPNGREALMQRLRGHTSAAQSDVPDPSTTCGEDNEAIDGGTSGLGEPRVRVEACRWSPLGVQLVDGRPPTGIWSLPGWKEGQFDIQDEGSQLIALATGLGPWSATATQPCGEDGPVILDLCAGNGGKSLALAGLTGDRGVMWAYDIDQLRLRQLAGATDRVGARSIRVVMGGGGNSEVSTGVPEALAALQGQCDLVLVDAPCSSTGVLRRRPSLRWTLREGEALHHMPSLQRSLLAQAQACVRPKGGSLVYATCSLLRQENQDVAIWFGEQYADFQPWSLNPAQDGIPWPLDGCVPGEDHMMTLLPHLHGTDGFFIARWRRSGDAGA